jgi:hypothetical protein
VIRSGKTRKVYPGIPGGNLIKEKVRLSTRENDPMREVNTVQRLRFMELVQKCLPFRWQRYWDCGSRFFDVSLMLQDTENTKIGRSERVLLGLLARIGSGRTEPSGQLLDATRSLDRERRQIVRRWLKVGEGEHLPLVANPESRATVSHANP